MYLQNCHAQFRHDFELKAVPERAPLFITADQWYRLHVNGRYVCRGPARGYQSHWPFDEIDVRGFLKPGHNVIAVEAYNPGIGTFQYLHRDDAGMICAAEWGETHLHSDKRTWRMRRAPANNPNVARLSRQMGFQEDFDANADDLSWISSPVPPEWKEHEMFRWTGETEFGRPPWNAVEERGIPMLREELVAPERISVHGYGPMKNGYGKCFNIAWHWQEYELPSVKRWLPGDEIPACRLNDGLEFEIAPSPKGEFHAVVLAMPEILFGTFGLEIAGGAGGEIVDCFYCQYLKDGIPQDILPAVGVGMIALATRLRVAPGHSSRMFMTPQGAKFIILVFRDVRVALKAKAVWRTMEYPFSMRGSFETSDKLLNDIHRLCKHTQQICSADAYIDTPWREQGQWWGDARVQGRNTFYLDGDARLLKRGIYSIAGQETDNGLTYGVAPCCNGGCILPDFSLTWILTVFDYWWQTGNLDVFTEQHGRIKRILAYFKSPEARAANGLLKFDRRYWLFEDWAPLYKEGCPAFLNLWHLYCLVHYAWLLRAAKLDADAEKAEAEIELRKASLTEAFFDERQGLFIGGRDLDGKPCPIAPSLHDQVLAILAGLNPEAWNSMTEKRLLPFLRDEPCDFATPTAFWCTYLFDAAKILGLRREAMNFIRSHWKCMIPYGGAWEHLNWNPKEGQSCCHAWSAHPVSHMVELFCGLKQLAPKWEIVEIVPDASLLPKFGDIRVPLPQGDLSFSWNDGEGRVSVLEGVETRWGGDVEWLDFNAQSRRFRYEPSGETCASDSPPPSAIRLGFL
ncbi:MAG: hypothetical protein WC708_03005 [Lentisphaeria bacterium]